MIKNYNIRVYGILKNNKNEVLVTDEHRMGINMTKFPGGGLEAGEGLLDCLKREWLEELNVEIEILTHFYTTDFYVKSAFNSAQLISIYYCVKPKDELKIKISNRVNDFNAETDGAQIFRWIDLATINESDFTFPIDKKVAGLLRSKF